MLTNSRDGKFTISIPSISQIDNKNIDNSGTTNKRLEVYLEANEGNSVNLYDVAYTLAKDCFGEGICEYLDVKSLYCHLSVGNKKYDFFVEKYKRVIDYLLTIVGQFKL